MVSVAPTPQQLSLADLKALSVLGQCVRGVVFHVPVAAAAARDISTDAREEPGLSGGGDRHRRIWFECDVLLALCYPLLLSLRGVMATDAIVSFTIDRCPGGDLKSLQRRWQAETLFPDSVIRFYAVEMVLALEHLHGLGVVYRDLKPKNMLIPDSSHIMLIYFYVISEKEKKIKK
ncbi:serine/threonine-protein kinase OXI1-like [Phragmites australis]|uniref:serine/threonine-protein kinase OXI1-like n=1 Tax=Phragmites australis TaxID=29695 RepID=UPI002D7785EF|nr:serine/threonine-protein kinase OXI1-like [Phragmites australis]